MEYLGECDTCGEVYDLGSREGRCGECGECKTHCTHTEGEKKMDKEKLMEALQKTIDQAHDKNGNNPFHLVTLGFFAGLSKDELNTLEWKQMDEPTSVSEYINAYYKRYEVKGEN